MDRTHTHPLLGACLSSFPWAWELSLWAAAPHQLSPGAKGGPGLPAPKPGELRQGRHWRAGPGARTPQQPFNRWWQQPQLCSYEGQLQVSHPLYFSPPLPFAQLIMSDSN